MAMLDTAAVSYQVVLTKADKINSHELQALSQSVATALTAHAAAFPRVIATSAEKGTGIGELRAAIAELLAERS
jgi:GTP-binding protein